MRKWMMAAAMGAALLAGCGREPTAVRAPQQPRLTASPLAVTLTGPIQPQYGISCAYTATATGGTPPYTYSWLSSGISGSGSGDTYWGTISTTGPKTLTVTVMDDLGEEATTSITRSGTQSIVGCR
ncbi:MAG: hypothetical protein JO306_06405 [Gemmatimonadetes bacterium]|nr:hypothetical protein [Gemmatimonadota bacterium]